MLELGCETPQQSSTEHKMQKCLISSLQ